MTSRLVPDHRVDVILEELERRVRHQGILAMHANIELAKFIEEVHKTLQVVIGLTTDKGAGAEWNENLQTRGYDLKGYCFKGVRVIYDLRNHTAHSSPRQHLMTNKTVQSDLGVLREAFEHLVALLPVSSFVSTFIENQTCSVGLGQAETLRATLTAMVGPVDALDLVLGYALPILPQQMRSLLELPREEQMAAALFYLVPYAREGDEGHLYKLARELEQHLPQHVERKPLRQWMSKVKRTDQTALSAIARIRLIHAHIDEDPDTSGGLLLRSLRIVEPPISKQEDYLPPFPMPFASVDQLYTIVSKVLPGLMKAFRERTGSDMTYSKMVLQLDVPPGFACAPFEQSQNKDKVLSDRFRCVVVQPAIEDRVSRSIQRAIDHPRANDNCLAVWQPLNTSTLWNLVKEKACYLAGPALWDGIPQDPPPPAVGAFDDVGCAILAQDTDQEALIGRVFGDHPSRLLEDLFEAVTTLRKAGERLVVFWDDPDYTLLPAQPV